MKLPQFELPDHLHDLYELVYIYEGTGTFFIDKTLYGQKPGDLFIIPGNTVHRSNPEETAPIVSTAVFFAPALAGTGTYEDSYSLLHCFEQSRKRKSYKLELPSSLRPAIESMLASIHDENEQQLHHYRAAIRLELGRLLLQLNRHLAEYLPPRSQEHKLGPSWIKETLHEIDAHPEHPHSLAAFAGKAAVSEAHFSRAFKQFTGMNVTDYVNAKRIILAKELLQETEDSIAVIAEKCGFASIPHFHRMFKALTDCTPSAYRKEKQMD